MPTPDTDIATVLQTAGVATLGTDMWKGPVRDSADDTDQLDIFVLTTGGFQPEPFFGGPDAGDLRRVNVQITVRSARGNFEDGQAKVIEVFDAVHKQAPATYAGWLADEPVFVEIDNKQRHTWAINVQCIYDT